MPRDPSAQLRATESIDHRLRRSFSWDIVLEAKKNLGYGDGELEEPNPRKWNYDDLQAECRRLRDAG